MTDTMTTRWELVIEHDHFSGTPELYYAGLEFKMVSFNNRHINFEDPNALLEVESECELCGGDGWDRDYEDNPGLSICEPCEGSGYTTVMNPNVLAPLSYYEHGLCRWMVGDSTVSDYGGFDTVGLAGVIVKGDEFDDAAWLALDDETRITALDWVAEEWTHWSNGETYTYQLREIEITRCGCCGENTEKLSSDDWNVWNSVIGTDAMVEEIRNGLIPSADGSEIGLDDIDFDRLTIVGDAAHGFDIADFETAQ